MFFCGRRHVERCEAANCNAPAVAACEAELAGKREGETCDRRLCVRCVQTVGSLRLCGAHRRALGADVPQIDVLRVWTASTSYTGMDRLRLRGSVWSVPSLVAADDEGLVRTDARHALYVAAMRCSWRRNRAVWDELLGRERVTLVCFCVRADRCQRSWLAELLGRCGARVMGERRS